MASWSAAYDVNFACCGGCSSSKRADAYNDKLANGARIFIWDVKLKTSPAPVCLLTFPYDRALNEQEGDRRVRSGRLVGTGYPIDHDFDSLCCEQRGLCQAIEEDASGKCQCVKKWGFTGDHCEYSVYEVAAKNNSALFPPITNLSGVTRLLPDLRSYLVDFDIKGALTTSRASAEDTANLFSVFKISDTVSYRQFAWSSCAYVVLGAAFFVFVFLVQLIWSFCCFKCGCRKKDPRKQPRIYSKATKIACGVVMMLFLTIGTAAAVLSFLTVHTKLIPGNDAILRQLKVTLPDELNDFGNAFTKPFDAVIDATTSPDGASLSDLQATALATMLPLTFLDNQSISQDVLSEPVFTLLDGLRNFSLLYPTVNSPSIDCTKMNITPNALVRTRVGAATGCFRCKTCSQLMTMVADAKDRWKRGAYKALLDLRESREQLLDLASTRSTLTTAIVEFRDRVKDSKAGFLARTEEVAAQYDELSTEARQLVTFGFFGLMGLSGLTLMLSFMAFGIGITSNKRPMSRTTCFVGEVACVVALVLVGVLYSTAMMAHDGIVSLQLLNENMAVFVANDVVAEDATRWLMDESMIEKTGMNDTLAFADTLRVPPHPTPTDDDPARFDINDLYDLPALFELETQMRDHNSARASMFGWEDAFLATQYTWLYVWAFGNDTVASPYNATIHQTLLNSTTEVLMDPNNDTKLVTEDDLLYIQSVFNESWRGVDDRGASQNALIATQWFFVARLEQQKQRLDEYLTDTADVISSTKPLLQQFVAKTTELEAAEFALKATVEFYTETLRTAKLRDCSYDANCAWFRSAVNLLFAEFQDLITNAEFATLCCAVSVVSLLLGLLCAGCFASRLRRNIVKVYSAN